MVPRGGLEPPHLSATDSESVVSTNSATWADTTLQVILQFYKERTVRDSNPHALKALRIFERRCLPDSITSTLLKMVGITGLEPVTSRPPGVRATNCAILRNKLFELGLLPPRELNERILLTNSFQYGAGDKNRTCDLPLTRGLLYQLSYSGDILLAKYI